MADPKRNGKTGRFERGQIYPARLSDRSVTDAHIPGTNSFTDNFIARSNFWGSEWTSMTENGMGKRMALGAGVNAPHLQGLTQQHSGQKGIQRRAFSGLIGGQVIVPMRKVGTGVTMKDVNVAQPFRGKVIDNIESYTERRDRGKIPMKEVPELKRKKEGPKTQLKTIQKDQEKLFKMRAKRDAAAKLENEAAKERAMNEEISTRTEAMKARTQGGRYNIPRDN